MTLLRWMQSNSFTLCAAAVVACGGAFAAPSEEDRAAILSMAGDFKVDFSFEETLVLQPERGESEPHHSVAHETVQVLEDRGDFISLQHLLVVGEGEDVHVVKHWRQDWQYEDDTVHAFRGDDTWEPVKLSKKDRKGTWTQSVYMVDDSPRYEGVGAWRHVGDTSYWESAETWRPLPRREKARRDDYDVLVARNSHLITPDGWAHLQSNYKLETEEDVVLAWEKGTNTYTRTEDYDFSAAHKYWDETHKFWAKVREEWNDRFAEKETIHVTQPDETKVLWREILTLADDYSTGKLPEVVSDKVISEQMNTYVKLGATS
jgi:hypothetical protein